MSRALLMILSVGIVLGCIGGCTPQKGAHSSSTADASSKAEIEYLDIDAEVEFLGLSLDEDVSVCFDEDAEGYRINGGSYERPYLVDEDTIWRLTRTPVVGDGYVKWKGFVKRGTFLGNTDCFDGVIPVSKLNDPVFVAMNLPNEAHTYMTAEDNRKNPINMTPARPDHKNYVSIGAIYMNNYYDGGIADDDEITVCVGKIKLLVHTKDAGWKVADEMAHPAYPRFYALPWNSVPSIALDDRIVDKKTHIEITVTGAMLKGKDVGSPDAKAGTLHFWGTRYAVEQGNEIEGCVGSFVAWVKDPEDAGKLVGASAVDMRIDDTDNAEQAYEGCAIKLTAEPRIFFGHNVGPARYDEVMDTDKVQKLLGITE